jgi:penicillin-binding protein 1A
MGSGANTALPMVASVFKGLSYWKKPMLTQFTYDVDYFECPPFLEMKAKEAIEFAKTDSTYLKSKQLKDTLLEEILIRTDSIVLPPTQVIPLDTLLN